MHTSENDHFTVKKNAAEIDACAHTIAKDDGRNNNRIRPLHDIDARKVHLVLCGLDIVMRIIMVGCGNACVVKYRGFQTTVVVHESVRFFFVMRKNRREPYKPL
mgnify:CR=1 FL=1